MRRRSKKTLPIHLRFTAAAVAIAAQAVQVAATLKRGRGRCADFGLLAQCHKAK